jgi:hypothetical protein
MSRLAVLHTASYIALLCITFLAWGCSPKYTPNQGNPRLQTSHAAPDYASLSYWAAHPAKWDPSDSVPKPLRKTSATYDADVFFLHPTSFTNENDTLQDNANIDDSALNHKTDFSSILYQASVFNESCRVYAPRYRQAHLRMYYQHDTARALRAFDFAYQDIRQAFLHYLQTENKGRPIIIASHSQGTTHAKRLLREFFDTDSILRSQLVAAYLLGIPVEKAYYQVLQPCADSLSVGCYASWRTYRRGYQDRYISTEDTSISVVNPYSWKTSAGTMSRSMHKGAVLLKFNKVYTHTQSAAISGNALWISKPRFPGGFLYATRNYHAGDYNLFYLNIREDVSRRLRLYKAVRRA